MERPRVSPEIVTDSPTPTKVAVHIYCREPRKWAQLVYATTLPRRSAEGLTEFASDCMERVGEWSAVTLYCAGCGGRKDTWAV